MNNYVMPNFIYSSILFQIKAHPWLKMIDERAYRFYDLQHTESPLSIQMNRHVLCTISN